MLTGICFCQTLQAQVPAPTTLSLEYGWGKTARHRPEAMTFPLSQARLWGIHAMWETGNTTYWQRAHHQPRVGLAILGVQFGNDSILGTAYGAMPQVDFWLFHHKRWAAFIRGGFGFSYVSRPYDRYTNPENTTIGSRINNMTSLAFQLEYRLPRFSLSAGGRAVHVSNGRFSLPNLGLNTAVWSFAMAYRLSPDATVFYPKEKQTHDPSWHMGTRLGLGAHEVSEPGTPRFPVQVFSVFGVKSISPKFRLWAMLEASHHASAQVYASRVLPRIERTSDQFSWRYSVGAAGELMMGRVGFTTQYFLYLDPPFRGKNYFAFKVGPNVYWHAPDKANGRINPFIGGYLKAHQAIAQYIEITVGVIF